MKKNDQTCILLLHISLNMGTIRSIGFSYLQVYALIKLSRNPFHSSSVRATAFSFPLPLSQTLFMRI